MTHPGAGSACARVRDRAIARTTWCEPLQRGVRLAGASPDEHLREHPDALMAGVTMGIGAVCAALVIAASVRLTKMLVRARSGKAHAAL